VTLLEIDTLRVDVEEALARFRAEVLPQLREQPGYEGVLVLVSPEGPGLLVSLWSDEQAMEAAGPFAAGALARFATIFRAPPGREHYAVRLLDAPAGALAALET